ncbi:MAG: hypothetical protein O7F12_11225 [Nitrospirae bacterium]|nr:hypothetical protein [Nitrospirota bacterium]
MDTTRKIEDLQSLRAGGPETTYDQPLLEACLTLADLLRLR